MPQISYEMERSFLDKSFTVTNWAELKPFFDNLLDREINSKEELLAWLRDRSELEAVLSEDGAWRYIKMTCDSTDDKIRDHFNYFIQEITPVIAELSVNFGSEINNDPADRLIAATSILGNAPVVTADNNLKGIVHQT